MTAPRSDRGSRTPSRPSDEDGVRLAAGDHVAAQVQAGRTGRAVVVDVPDWDRSLAKLVEDALAAGAVAVAVARHAHVHVVVVDLRVEHCLDAGFETELGVVYFASGLDELGHAHAEDVDGFFCSGRHG